MRKCIFCHLENDYEVTCYEAHGYNADTRKYENREQWYCRACKQSWVVHPKEKETVVTNSGTLCTCCKCRVFRVKYENGYWYCQDCHTNLFKKNGVKEEQKEEQRVERDPPFFMQSLEGM